MEMKACIFRFVAVYPAMAMRRLPTDALQQRESRLDWWHFVTGVARAIGQQRTWGWISAYDGYLHFSPVSRCGSVSRNRAFAEFS
jgi:hypothetical protein